MVTGQSLYFLPRIDVPNLDGLVPATGSEPIAVRTERNTGNRTLMPNERANLGPGFKIPELDCLIGARRG